MTIRKGYSCCYVSYDSRDADFDQILILLIRLFG